MVLQPLFQACELSLVFGVRCAGLCVYLRVGYLYNGSNDRIRFRFPERNEETEGFRISLSTLAEGASGYF